MRFLDGDELYVPLRQQLERGDLVELPVDLATCTPSVELPENLTCPLTEPPVPVG